MKRVLASVLAALVMVLAPGPFAYQAAAQVVAAATAGQAVPSVPVATLETPINASAPVGAPLTLTPSIVASTAHGLTLQPTLLIGASATSAALATSGRTAPLAAAATASSASKPAVLTSARTLGGQLAGRQNGGAAAPKARVLEKFWTGSVAAADPENDGGAPQENNGAAGGNGLSKPSGAPADAKADVAAPAAAAPRVGAAAPRVGAAAPRVGAAAPDRFTLGFFHKTAMQAMAATWWVWDRALTAMGTSWDKMPAAIGELYLYFNEQSLRLHVWDANAEPTTDKTQYAKANAEQLKYRSADGSYMDDQRPGMAKAGARFNQLRKPAGPPDPHFEKMEPNPMVLSERLMKRERGADGNPVIKEIPANSWFASHIQRNVHDWENHEQLPITRNPVSFTIPKGHPLAPEGGTMVLNRTATDPTLPADYQGPAIHRNLEASPWDMSDLYGSSAEIQKKVRTFEGGHVKLEKDGRLPDDPEKPGIPLTGFNNNMSVPLAMQNIVWAHEHNANADAIDAEYRAKGVQLSDEELFQKARLRISAVNAKIHTTEWTRWLLAGSKTLWAGMWHDWYGFLDKKAKLWVMRASDQHPKLGWVLGKLLRYELIFGIPGTATEHYGKNYNFVEEFPDVYRLHELIRDAYRMQKLTPDADGTITVSIVKPIGLRELVGPKVQQQLKDYPLEDWALTFGNEKVGELTLNNFPDALRDLTAQDGVKDGHKIDLAAIDIIRTRERMEASTYVKFTVRLGEKPPRTFEELTGGNKEAAEKLRQAYKSVDQVDFQIGILAERKPVGFALGNRQFKVFVLSAPGRLKNDRFLSSQYSAKTYDQSGLEYIETTNFANILARAFPSLKQLDLEAMDNAYRPWRKPGELQAELVASAQSAADGITQAEKTSRIANVGLAAVAGGLALAGIIPVSAAAMAAVLAAAPWALASLGARSRSAGVEGLRNVSAHSKNASERASLMKPLFDAENAAERGALWGRVGAVIGMDMAGMLAMKLWAAPLAASLGPVAAALLGGAAIVTGFIAWRRARALQEPLRLARVYLYAKLNEGREHLDPAALPGATSLEKRYWMLLNGKAGPVAKFSDSYAALRKSGISAFTALGTAGLGHLILGPRTQSHMTAEQKALYKPGRFDVYVPGMIDAQDYSNTRTYMSRETAAAKGAKPGDLDMAEFDRIFRDFGANRGYVTAYDLSRMRQQNAWRDANEGRGNPLSRFFGVLNSKRRAEQTIDLLSDRVVWEDGLHGKLVPAVSREQLLRLYRGTAQIELARDRQGKPDEK